jgi:cytochrome c1
MMKWIVDPQAVSPGTAMPRLGVTPADSRDITAFLYTRT